MADTAEVMDISCAGSSEPATEVSRPLLSAADWQRFAASQASKVAVMRALGSSASHLDDFLDEDVSRSAEALGRDLRTSELRAVINELAKELLDKPGPKTRLLRRLLRRLICFTDTRQLDEAPTGRNYEEKHKVHIPRDKVVRAALKLISPSEYALLTENPESDTCKIRNTKDGPRMDAVIVERSARGREALNKAKVVIEYKRAMYTKNHARLDCHGVRAVGQVVRAHLVKQSAFDRLARGDTLWGAIADQHFWTFVALTASDSAQQPCKVRISKPVPVLALSGRDQAANLQSLRLIVGWFRLCLQDRPAEPNGAMPNVVVRAPMATLPLADSQQGLAVVVAKPDPEPQAIEVAEAPSALPPRWGASSGSPGTGRIKWANFPAEEEFLRNAVSSDPNVRPKALAKTFIDHFPEFRHAEEKVRSKVSKIKQTSCQSECTAPVLLHHIPLTVS